jgi:hypothetical protein
MVVSKINTSCLPLLGKERIMCLPQVNGIMWKAKVNKLLLFKKRGLGTRRNWAICLLSFWIIYEIVFFSETLL